MISLVIFCFVGRGYGFDASYFVDPPNLPRQLVIFRMNILSPFASVFGLKMHRLIDLIARTFLL